MILKYKLSFMNDLSPSLNSNSEETPLLGSEKKNKTKMSRPRNGREAAHPQAL